MKDVFKSFSMIYNEYKYQELLDNGTYWNFAFLSQYKGPEIISKLWIMLTFLEMSLLFRLAETSLCTGGKVDIF